MHPCVRFAFLAILAAVLFMTGCGGSPSATSSPPSSSTPAVEIEKSSPPAAPSPSAVPAAPTAPTALGGKFAIDGDAALAAKLAQKIDASPLWKDLLAGSTASPAVRCSVTSQRTVDGKGEPAEYKSGFVVLSMKLTGSGAGEQTFERKKGLPSVIQYNSNQTAQTAAFEKVENELLAEMSAQTALQAMAQSKSATYAPAISALLANEKETPAVRATAAKSLVQVGPVSQENARMLVKYACVTLDTNREVSNGCTEALKSAGSPGIEALQELLSSPDINAKTRAIESLGRIGAPAATALAEALKDKSWLSYQAVLKELSKLGAAAEPARATLLEDLKDKNTMIAEAAAHGLAKIGRASVPGLTAALDAKLPESTCGAILSALGSMGAEASDALPALEAYAKKQKGYLASAAKSAIEKIKAGK